MAWQITGYPTMATAAVQDGALLAPSTPSQPIMNGIQVNNTGSVQATITVSLASGFVLPCIVPTGTSMWPHTATNYTTAASGITVYSVRTT